MSTGRELGQAVATACDAHAETSGKEREEADVDELYLTNTPELFGTSLTYHSARVRV